MNALAVMAKGGHTLTDANPALLPRQEYISTLVEVARNTHGYAVAMGRQCGFHEEARE